MSIDPVSDDSETNKGKKFENHPFMKKKIKKNHQEHFNFSTV